MRKCCSKTLFTFFLILSLFLLPSPVFAQSNSGTESSSGDSLVIKLAVIGPGDELYFWWGHIGIIIEDYETNRSRFYDWGVFSFENTNFFSNFAMGRLIYSCAVSAPTWNLRNYIETNRDITIYTMDLPADKKEEVRDFAEWSVLPENKDYFYHHFKDNCATRVRDIFDRATDGAFKARYGDAPGRYTLRQHVRRHTWFSPFFDWFLNFLMGRNIDQSMTVWEEMFLPAEIGARALEFSYTGSDGIERKLVSSVEKLNTAVNRPQVLDVPRLQWPRELVFGCALAVVLGALLFFKNRENRIASIIWVGMQGILGLFFGISGLVLFFMTFFTNHDYTYYNINILYINPLLIGAVVFGILHITASDDLEKYKWDRAIKAVWSYVLVFGSITTLLRLIPGLYQMNLVTLAMVLPFAAVLGFLPDLLVYIRREYLWRWFN
ncbi:membrane protein [Spirochaetia bacterium]|nr:membrane protein [Spirochaetia bacterium]